MWSLQTGRYKHYQDYGWAHFIDNKSLSVDGAYNTTVQGDIAGTCQLNLLSSYCSMIKKTALFHLLVIGASVLSSSISTTLSAQITDPILQKCIARLSGFHGFEYNASFKMKFFDNTDTTDFFSRHCKVLKREQDTILKYHAIVSNGQTDIGYTGEHFFMCNKQEKWIKKEPVAVLGRNFIRNNIGLNFIPSFFYSTAPLSSWINTASTVSRAADTIVGSRNYYLIKFIFKPDEEITRSERYLYIDRQTYLPVKMQIFSEYKGIQQEYQELIIKNLKGINNKKATIHYSFIRGLEPEPFGMPGKKTVMPLLSIGTTLPPFAGTDLSGQPFYAENVSGYKLVLLDFWHLACAPCLKSIPELAALQHDYFYRGLQVIGLNSTDTSAQKIAEIKKFIPVLRMNYPVILVGKETEQIFQVTVWPTVYLIENGKIIHAASGYTERDIKKLRELIEQRL